MRNLTSYTIVFILVFLLLEACAQAKQPNAAIFSEIDELSLPLTDPKYNSPYTAQLSDDSTQLYVHFNRNKIYIYNLHDKQIADSILLPSKSQLMSFNIIGRDSILLLFNASAHKYYNHEHTLFLINKKGEILKDYSMEQSPAITSQGQRDSETGYCTVLLGQQLQYSNDKIYLNFYKYDDKNIGEADYPYKNSFIAGYMNKNTGDFSSSPSVQVPFLKKGEYFPRDVEYVETKIGHNGNPIYAFAHTDLLLEYNPAKMSVTEHHMKYSQADTIAPLNVADEGRLAKKKFKYSYLYYDKYRNYYYRFIQLPENKYGQWKYGFVVADTSFNVIGEGILPDNMTASMIFFSEDNIWSVNLPKTYEEKGSVVFSRSHLEFNKSGNALCNVNSGGSAQEKSVYRIEDYLKNNAKISDSTFAAIIIPISYSCPSCVEQTLRFYSVNQKILSENPVYLILVEQNKVFMDEKMKEYKLSSTNSKIKTDNTDKYHDYHNFDSYNPRLILIKNNKISSDKVYTPAEMKELQKNLSDFLGLKSKK